MPIGILSALVTSCKEITMKKIIPIVTLAMGLLLPLTAAEFYEDLPPPFKKIFSINLGDVYAWEKEEFLKSIKDQLDHETYMFNFYNACGLQISSIIKDELKYLGFHKSELGSGFVASVCHGMYVKFKQGEVKRALWVVTQYDDNTSTPIMARELVQARPHALNPIAKKWDPAFKEPYVCIFGEGEQKLAWRYSWNYVDFSIHDIFKYMHGPKRDCTEDLIYHNLYQKIQREGLENVITRILITVTYDMIYSFHVLCGATDREEKEGTDILRKLKDSLKIRYPETEVA